MMGWLSGAIAIFWLSLVVIIVIFVKNRKWYQVMYVLSITTYIFTLFYVIDAFHLSKNIILGLLLASAFVMIAIGSYIAKKHKK